MDYTSTGSTATGTSTDYASSSHGAGRGEAEQQREGVIARTIEEQTAQLPSDTFLWAALGSIAASMTLQIMGHQKTSLFVGQWAPTFLILGLYNKIVKTHGHDRSSESHF